MMDIYQRTHSLTPTLGNAAVLACAECGAQVEAPPWAGWLRCPECGSLGHADRAGRYLLSVGWDCPACGSRNDGLAHFCLECGAGLPSHCLHCEGPVYTAVCHRCGSHQGRLLRYQIVQAQRAEWAPILRSYASPARRSQPQGEPAPSPGRRRARQERHRTAREAPSRRDGGWGLIWIGAGVLLLMWQLREEVSRLALQAEASPAFQPGIAAVRAWWAGFLPAIGSLPKDSSEYSTFFASVVFGVSLLPVALAVIYRLLQRLFP